MKRAANFGQPWTQQHDDELRALTTAGNRTSDIAYAMGRTLMGIEARQKLLGICRPKVRS